MTYARKQQLVQKDTSLYHVWARCVRRSFLWGKDKYSGHDFSHRKVWVLERLQELAEAFAIDCCAYGVMSNHYHLALAVARERALRWNDEEVVQRWGKLFKVPLLVQRWLAGQASEAEVVEVIKIIDRWRHRLYDISWYMRCMNQRLAERANEEDGVSGRFWDGRYRLQALLDEAGLLSVMVYIDLNPVRSGEALTPEESEFTSIFQRIQELLMGRVGEMDSKVPLMPFKGDEKNTNAEVSNAEAPSATENEPFSMSVIPCRFEDYLVLLDWTGRSVRPDKRGSIDERLPPILERLGIDADAWVQTMRPRGNVFGRAMGRLERLRHHAQTLSQCWIRGLSQAQRLYGLQPVS